MSFKEIAWVDYLKKSVKLRDEVLVGIGDDCALVKPPRSNLLLKSDLFIEGIHFKKGAIDYKTIGMRAVARVLSDFAACGGLPKFIGVSAGLPPSLKVGQLRRIVQGILSLSKKYKFSLVGGDTSRASRLFLDVWGVGEAKKCILRSTAKTGDCIFITAPLGKRKFNRPFKPRIEEAQFLVRNFKVNAMIDISDGFALDLYRILKESKKGALLYYHNIPLTKGEGDLYRGEDYELIFTVDKREKRLGLLEKKFYRVGTIMPQSFGYKIEKNKAIRPLTVKGYLYG